MSNKTVSSSDKHTRNLHMQHLCVCEVKSPSDTRAATTHRPLGLVYLAFSVLTRVSGGIKEALRDTQKSSTCVLKERKHKS